MTTRSLKTSHAPAPRSSPAVVKRQAEHFTADPLLRSAVDTGPNFFVILNPDRQIVFANRPLLDALGLQSEKDVLGLRAGELLGCIHSGRNPAGCGTTRFCTKCGAAGATLAAQEGRVAVEECRIVQENGQALDLRVWTQPLNIDGDCYTILALSDISNEKRRQALERTFFHDVLNTATGLRGLCWMMHEADGAGRDEMLDQLGITSQQLIDEIQGQRILLAAEKQELAVKPTPLNSADLLRQIAKSYESHEVGVGRTICVDPSSTGCRFSADRTLIARTLGNLIKNALEAVAAGDSITVGSTNDDSHVAFWVHNTSYMPRATQLQMFQRSYSTKGPGRGLGTYSAKLLTEQYLHGEISFTTSRADGTIFTVRLPIGTSSRTEAA